jgi:hypothetical protein
MTGAYKPPKVCIGMPIGSGSLPWPTCNSLLATIRVCDKEGIPIRVEAPTGCSVVQWARSVVVESFLKTDFTHLFWIDADIVWTPDDFFRLLGFGAVLDVVGATYPLKRDAGGFLINLAGEPNKVDVNGLGCIRVRSMGLGFTIVKRAVMERVAADKPRIKDAMNNMEYADVFRVDRTATGSPRGEDVAFFADVRDAGYKVWLDPSVQLGHVGQKVYRGDVIAALGLQDYAKQEKSA